MVIMTRVTHSPHNGHSLHIFNLILEKKLPSNCLSPAATHLSIFHSSSPLPFLSSYFYDGNIYALVQFLSILSAAHPLLSEKILTVFRS
ncbi:hypothetical protein LINGRAHAP2_LOCUS4644 [Linum grandiflorum]